MNYSQKIRNLSVITIAVVALFAGCERSNTAAPPAPSTAPDNTQSAPAAPATPPTGGSEMAPPPATSAPATPTPPDNSAAPGSTQEPPAAPANPAPAPSSSLENSSHGHLADVTPSVRRGMYGVEVTQVANETGGENRLTSSDQDFLKDAAQGGVYEVEAAKIGGERARTPRVKAFAQMLVSQHSAANAELKQLADVSNVEVPVQPPPMKRRTLDHLRKVDVKNFDHDFIKTVGIDDHEETIKRFEKATHEVKDESIRAWAEKTLPTLREHLAEALTVAMVSDMERKEP